MSFGPFRISCVSQQISVAPAVCVIVSLCVGGCLCFWLHFSHLTVWAKECFSSSPSCFLGIGADQNRLHYQDSESGLYKCRLSDLLTSLMTLQGEWFTSSSIFTTTPLYVPLQETRRLTQFHYMNWPDHDVPSSFDSILDMIGLMREYQEHDDVPICVHCR